jgi:carbon starvation protein
LAFQEMFMDSGTDESEMSQAMKVLTNKHFATLATLFVAYLLATGGYLKIWPLFGSANQLLSALALCALSVFLKKTNRQGVTLWAPMVIMLAITFTALGQTIIKICKKLLVTHDFILLSDGLQLVFAVLLIGLGCMVAVSCINKLFGKGDKASQQAVEA